MEIEYLLELKNNPTRDLDFTNKPISLVEISQLEQLYNSGLNFPKALKELLFLAGKYCIIFDYGLSTSQQELQDFVRENLQEENKTISRPFFAIDVYLASDAFLFVYLDEGDNPPLYEAFYSDNLTANQVGWIRKVSPSLSNFVVRRVQAVKEGRNPF